ncbi:PD-(D/E)XK nuclease domain-containing protein [Pedobacter nyackensis]|uniref:PD-(D/E)XK nuclease domain-containing protein n=1 Tax=Pedobacter nyackensis TaxID=475255 RepID=UPI00292F9133|nr:PD-(D/E)XK nuclease domain-containing protein [Pedobacter nyackensis]
MNKIETLEKYISDFFSTRYEDINYFYKTTHQNRQHEIYKLKKGTRLMDFVISIHSNIEDNLYAERLIPHKFVTPERLFNFLANFKTYLNDHQHLIDINNVDEDTDFVIVKIQEIKDDLVQMIDYVKQVYEMEDVLIPYQELRYYLVTKNVPKFIDILKSILASVSYAITKVHEGYFHSNVHLILKLLGFEIISEELTNNGRIDAVIRFMDIIYIIEFKFEDSLDKSKVALQQIKNKAYAEKFIIEHKEITGIGISFDKTSKNINGFIYEKLA